ncbi:MAG: hypothetical protein IPM18_02940 [Phycisphaerales bacterium]|nr:hypothetical protein [Phycisphaerales bacterium]
MAIGVLGLPLLIILVIIALWALSTGRGAKVLLGVIVVSAVVAVVVLFSLRVSVVTTHTTPPGPGVHAQVDSEWQEAPAVWVEPPIPPVPADPNIRLGSRAREWPAGYTLTRERPRVSAMDPELSRLAQRPQVTIEGDRLVLGSYAGVRLPSADAARAAATGAARAQLLRSVHTELMRANLEAYFEQLVRSSHETDTRLRELQAALRPLSPEERGQVAAGLVETYLPGGRADGGLEDAEGPEGALAFELRDMRLQLDAARAAAREAVERTRAVPARTSGGHNTSGLRGLFILTVAFVVAVWILKRATRANTTARLQL